MRLSDENTREGRHLTPEERIALQAEEIKQLWQENEQLQKERNAAIADMRHLVLIRGGGCSVCKHWNKANPKLPWCNKNYTCEFEWRGLEEGSV